MKAKLTLSVDADLIPKAKASARRQGTSLSALVERALWEASQVAEEPSIAAQWRGKFRPAERDTERYRYLAKKYL